MQFNMDFKSLRLISKLNIRLRYILVRLTWIFLFLFYSYYWLMFCWDALFWKNYRTQKIYIPTTNEHLYLITAQNRFDSCNDYLELTTCYWRIYKSPNHEYVFEESNTRQSNNTPIYYKVSNDTLYLLVNTPVLKPKKFKSKVKVQQISINEFKTERTFKGVLMFPSSPKHRIAEEDLRHKGYKKFP